MRKLRSNLKAEILTKLESCSPHLLKQPSSELMLQYQVCLAEQTKPSLAQVSPSSGMRLDGSYINIYWGQGK